MAKKKPHIFLDANVIIRCGKPPRGSEFSRIVDLVEADEVSIVTTDLTISEIAKNTQKTNMRK